MEREMEPAPGQKIWGLEWQAKDEARAAEEAARERAEEERRQQLRELTSHPYYQRHIDDVVDRERRRLTAVHEEAMRKLNQRWITFSFIVLPLLYWALQLIGNR